MSRFSNLRSQSGAPCEQALSYFRAGFHAAESDDWHGAVVAYKKCLIFAAGNPLLLCNLAHALWMTEQLDASETTLQQALELAPREGRLWRLVAAVHRDRNRLEEALAAFDQACALGSEDGTTAWNQSEVLMGLGRYPEAFRLAEERLEEPSYVPLFHRPPPYWEDWDNPDVPMRIWSEQGYGDTLQFVRWLPRLGHRRHLIVEVDPPLVTLLQRGLAWMPRPPQIVVKESWPQPSNGCQGSLLSLPHRLGGAPCPLPGAYLLDPAWQRQHRPQRLRPRVGVVWASGRRQENALSARLYRRRSLPTDSLITLLSGLEAMEVDLVNLQVGPDRNQAEAWAGSFAGALDPSADFAAMAECMADLDLTLSVDTAAAHLAGATGLPAWVLLPWNADGRWLRQRTDSPWYPSLKLWRQPAAGDWPGLVESVLEGFAKWRTSVKYPSAALSTA